MKKAAALLLLYFFLYLQIASAQSTDLDPVTITASVFPTNTSQTGRNVISINGEQLSQLPLHSIDELLRYLPGVEMQARGPMGAQSDISLRGGTFQQTLIMVDGIRVNDPNTGHFASYIPIAPSEIDRIEILKGASSAIYGSEAVGGVIHIITKSFVQKQARQLQANAQLTAGQYGLWSGNAGIAGSTGKTSFAAGVLTNNTNGQWQRGIRGFMHATTVSASLSHQINDHWNVALRTAFDRRRFAAQNFYTSFLSDTAQETVSTFWNQAQLTYADSNHTLRLQVGYKALQDSFLFNKLSVTNQNKSELWQALLTDERGLSAKTTIVPGIQFINKKIASNDRGNHNLSQAAGFVVLNQQIGQHFFAAPAIRLQWMENTGWEVVPQINLAYKYRKLNLRGSAGKTIRDADFTERYNNYGKAVVASGQRLGNPDLVAERSFSYEGGADYQVSNWLKVSSTFFQRFHRRLIDYVPTSYLLISRKENLLPTGVYAFAKNIAQVNTTGFETDVQFIKKINSKSQLWATAGLIIMQSKSSDTTPSLYISSHAKLLANFNIQYTYRLLQVSLNGLYKKRQPQKVASPLLTPVSADYFVLNAQVQFYIIPKKLSAFVQVDNLTDKTYTDLLGARMPNRWWMGGIKYSFVK